MPFEMAREALAAALRSQTGAREACRPAVLALAMAKCALETGRFQKIWNWNFGNIKAGESYVGMFTCITLNEVLIENGVPVVKWFAPDGPVIRLQGGGFTPTSAPRVAVPPGHPQTRMRAHANRFDGAYSYADFMQARPAMWGALQLGEPVAFVGAMKAARYMTADADVYARSVTSLFHEFRLRLEGRTPDEVRLPEHEWIGARGFAALAMARAADDAIETAAAERDI
jgi:hypothetical protein